jgi:hypothetical protein
MGLCSLPEGLGAGLPGICLGLEMVEAIEFSITQLRQIGRSPDGRMYLECYERLGNEYPNADPFKLRDIALLRFELEKDGGHADARGLGARASPVLRFPFTPVNQVWAKTRAGTPPSAARDGGGGKIRRVGLFAVMAGSCVVGSH